MKKIITFMITLVIISALNISAQKKVVPIFSDSNLLGGVENGRWLDAKTTVSKLKGDEKLSLFYFGTGQKGEMPSGKLTECADVCSENYCIGRETEIAADLSIG